MAASPESRDAKNPDVLDSGLAPSARPGMTVESEVRKLQHRHSFLCIFLHACLGPSGSVAARRIPAGCRAKLSVSYPSQSQAREAERRNSQARNAAPVGLPCG